MTDSSGEVDRRGFGRIVKNLVKSAGAMAIAETLGLAGGMTMVGGVSIPTEGEAQGTNERIEQLGRLIKILYETNGSEKGKLKAMIDRVGDKKNPVGHFEGQIYRDTSCWTTFAQIRGAPFVKIQVTKVSPTKLLVSAEADVGSRHCVATIDWNFTPRP